MSELQLVSGTPSPTPTYVKPGREGVLSSSSVADSSFDEHQQIGAFTPGDRQDVFAMNLSNWRTATVSFSCCIGERNMTRTCCCRSRCHKRSEQEKCMYLSRGCIM